MTNYLKSFKHCDNRKISIKNKYCKVKVQILVGNQSTRTFVKKLIRHFILFTSQPDF